MSYVRLGNSGLKVSKIILGTMTYGDPRWQGWVLDEEASLPHFKLAWDKGVNNFDSDPIYSNGASEIIVGKAIKKYNIPRESRSRALNPRVPSNRKNLFSSVDASLARLQLDYIDVLQCHRFDYETPIEETMQALHDIVQTGKVRYIGMSSCFAYQFHAMQNYAINNKLTPFISMQNYHNAIYREEEREVFPTCKHFGMGIIPWSPIARGALARPVASEATMRSEKDPFVCLSLSFFRSRAQAVLTPSFLLVYSNYKGRGLDRPDDSEKEIINRVEAIAKKRGISMAQVATAWSIAQPGVTAPIVGSTSLAHLEDLIEAVHIKLTPEEIEEINEPYTHRAIIGHI
ncbi:NADP-dependent oxidoreductase domain-containing protein [Mrakia frigida]|uniref:aldo/keto reductase n=1 Tax=Mrakia frigida TaxID=29902 RepID=UPI003FCC15D7